MGLVFPSSWSRKSHLLVLLCSIGTTHCQAQLIVDTVSDVEQMLLDLFGPAVTSISNLQMLGATNYRGTFNGANTDLGLDAGLLLANGDIHLAIGPNDTVEAGIFDGNGLVGDADLTAIAGYPTQDASVLECDFVPASDTITFHFVFGSEEYPEWVSLEVYNDVFAILLDGVNIALLPDAAAVCVNNVNCFGANPLSYRCNDPMNAELVPCSPTFNCPDSVAETTIQYDGLTVPLQARAVFVPGSTHHLKLGIADVSDNGADAGAFVSVSYSAPVNGIASTSAEGTAYISPNPNTGSFRYHFPYDRIERLVVLDQMGRSIVNAAEAELDGIMVLPPSIAPGVYELVGFTCCERSAVRFVVAP